MRLHKDYIKPQQRLNVSKNEMNYLLNKYTLDTEFHIKNLENKINKREYEILNLQDNIKKAEKTIKMFARRIML